MANFSNYLQDELINGTLRNTAYTPPATVYMALYTSNPTKANTGTELSGNGYVRTAITFAAPSSGVSSNSAIVTFPTCTTANWGVITHFALFDAQTTGHMLYFGALTASVTVNVGETFVAQIGGISVTLS